MKKDELQAKDLPFPVLERAALYARVSSDDRKREGRNLAGQLAMDRQYAKEKNYKVVVEIEEDDRGASGYEIDLPGLNRIRELARKGEIIDLPGLNRIRELARKGEIEVVIVREIDRLSRNLAKQLIVEEELRRHGVRVEYVLAEYEDTPEGRLNKHIRATIAEYEREKIKERMLRGKRNKVKEGKVMRTKHSPYGLNYTEDGNGLVINEEKARIVKDIFRMCLGGWGTPRIAGELDRLGVPTPAGARHWYPSTIQVILTNRNYIGEWGFGRRNSRKKLEAGSSDIQWETIYHPKEYHLIVSIPPILDRETFDAAQAKLKANPRLNPRNTKYNYLLGRRLTCQCGATVCATSSKKGSYKYYRCNASIYVHGYKCNMKQFGAKKLDSRVWAELTDYINDPKKLKAALADYQKEVEQVIKPLQERSQTVDRLLEHWKAEWENTIASIRSTKSEKAKAFFNEELERIEATVAELETERAALANKIQAEGMNDDQILTLVEFTQQMAADWEEISQTFEKRRAVIDYLDIRITLMLTPERQCKGILTGILPGGAREFWIDDSRSGMTGMPPVNLEHLRIRRGGPMRRSSNCFYLQPSQ